MDPATNYGVTAVIGLLLLILAVLVYLAKLVREGDRRTKCLSRAVRRMRGTQKKDRVVMSRLRTTMGFVHFSLERLGYQRAAAAPSAEEAPE
jgi:hypothetical protein